MNWTNEITQRLKIRYPIIQAPMFGVSTPAMVASASSTGSLGSLPLGDLPGSECVERIRALKQLTGHPFAVNIFAHQVPDASEDLKKQYARTKEFIENLARERNLKVNLPDIEEIEINGHEEQVDAILAEGCKIVSFTFGNLDASAIQKLKSKGTTLIGTCTSVKEAKVLENGGIDIICVQGIEAGGHRGSFSADNIPEIGGFSLLAQVYDAVKVPLIYAGGIYNARSLMAIKKLGAQGFQIGSLLLGAEESALKEFEKEKLRNVREEEIILSKSFSGRYARGIRNAFIDAMENSGLILPYPYQNKLTKELRKASKAKERLDFVGIWLGQSINQFNRRSTAEIIKELITETEKEIRAQR